MVNDAAMQALGSYEGGRMLFLGLGTGLGSTLITGHVIIPLELGRLLYDSERATGRGPGPAAAWSGWGKASGERRSAGR